MERYKLAPAQHVYPADANEAMLHLFVLIVFMCKLQAGQAFHLATAMHSTNLAVQHQALKCIKVLMPVLTRHDEQLLITALESLMGGVEDSNSVTGESLDSCGEGDSDSDMEI